MVHGKNTRNSEPAVILIRADTVADLRPLLASKLPTAQAFNMPNKDYMIELLRGDLEVVRESWVAQDPENRARSAFLRYVDSGPIC